MDAHVRCVAPAASCLTRNTTQMLLTDVVVSSRMLDQRIVAAVTVKKPFYQTLSLKLKRRDAEVNVYVAKIKEDGVDMHVVVEGESTIELLEAMRDISRYSTEPLLRQPLHVTEAARQRLNDEVHGKTPAREPGFYYALDTPPEGEGDVHRSRDGYAIAA